MYSLNKTIIDSTANDGSYEWKPIPVVETDTAKVRISDVLGTSSDTSDGNFSIALPVWLDFQPEMTFDDGTVTWSGYTPYLHSMDEISPAISQDTDGTVHVMFYGINTGSSSRDCQARSQDGVYWTGSGGFWNSSSDFGRDDLCKIAPSHNGLSWGCTNLSWVSVGWYSDVDRGLGGPGYYCFDGARVTFNTTPHRYPEVATDTAGYVFMFGDELVLNQISWNKTKQPGFNEYGGPDQVTAVQQLTSNGIISKTRSWARQGQGVALIFSTSTGNIMLAETTDAPTNDNWDASEIVWTKTSDYDTCHTPSLNADSSGRLFASWVAHNTSLGQWEILASMRETPSSSWTTPAVVTTSALEFKDVHISSAPVLLPTDTTEDVAMVTWENDNSIGSALSPLDLAAFLPVQDVSSQGANTRSPDGMCISGSFGYSYDTIITWSQQNSSQDIVVRNADFETP